MSDLSILLPLLKGLSENKTDFSSRIGQQYNPAAQWMPGGRPLLGVTNPEGEKTPNKPTLLGEKSSPPIGSMFSGKGGGIGGGVG